MAETAEKEKPKPKGQDELNIEAYARIYELCHKAAGKLTLHRHSVPTCTTNDQTDQIAELFFTRFWDDQKQLALPAALRSLLPR
jgi:hypothetical protein